MNFGKPEDLRRCIMVGTEGPSREELIRRSLQPGMVKEALDPRQRIMIGTKGPSTKDLIDRCLHGPK